MKIRTLFISTAVLALTTLPSVAAPLWQYSLIQSPMVDPTPISLISVDVNGDNKPDLISASYDNSTLTVLTNAGDGMFGSNAVYKIDPNGYSGLYSVAAADVNGDGSTDLLVAMYDNVFSIVVLTNNGSGNFHTNSTYGDAEGIQCVIASDVNGDKKPDLVYLNAWNNTVSVLTNDGTGAFVTSGSYSVGQDPISAVTVDVNHDGALDLVIANSGSFNNHGTLTVLTNDGAGQFVVSTTLSAGRAVYWVAAADINGDDSPDLICANYEGGTLSVFTNDESGNFSTNATLATDGSPYFVTPVDINGDGKMSLIAAVDLGFNTPGELEIFNNDGAGHFSGGDRLTTGFSPDCIAAADFNGDGRTDLVAANYNDFPATLSVFLNYPLLDIGLTPTNTVSVTWPALSLGWQLQQTTNVAIGLWQRSPLPISSDGTNNSINAPTSGNLFFRLAQPAVVQ